ncbi:GNAT family N-acetyltransferase [Undibacterium arcticum]|uniref:GNAT family N-acetyltransferase n=1 Tax=Undibacterium arcticum TaxID=1762892 RepID=A0ABV7F3K0_9BURK
MNIRRLTPTDAPAYRALMLDAYQRHPDAFTSSVSERTALPLAWWESRLQLEPLASEVVFGAFRDERLAGVAGLSFESREKARHKATLFGMVVPAESRQGGLGRQLVLAALAHARGRDGVRVVQLTVRHGNAAAQALYERCGFVQFGLEPFAVAVGAEFVSKVHMWCDLGCGLSLQPPSPPTERSCSS